VLILMPWTLKAGVYAAISFFMTYVHVSYIVHFISMFLLKKMFNCYTKVFECKTIA